MSTSNVCDAPRTRRSLAQTVAIGGLLLSIGCSGDSEVVAPKLSTTATAQEVPLHRASPADRVPGEYIVMLAPGGSPVARSARLQRAAGGEVMHVFERLNGFSIRGINATALANLRTSQGIRYIEENATLHTSTSAAVVVTPTEQDPAPWHLGRIDQQTGTDGEYLWSEPTPSNSRIYIVDTGVREPLHKPRPRMVS